MLHWHFDIRPGSLSRDCDFSIHELLQEQISSTATSKGHHLFAEDLLAASLNSQLANTSVKVRSPPHPKLLENIFIVVYRHAGRLQHSWNNVNLQPNSVYIVIEVIIASFEHVVHPPTKQWLVRAVNFYESLGMRGKSPSSPLGILENHFG